MKSVRLALRLCSGTLAILFCLGCAAIQKKADTAEVPGPPKADERLKAEIVAEYKNEVAAENAAKDKWREEYRRLRGAEVGLDMITTGVAGEAADAEISVLVPMFRGFAFRGSANTTGGAGKAGGSYGWRVGVRLY